MTSDWLAETDSEQSWFWLMPIASRYLSQRVWIGHAETDSVPASLIDWLKHPWTKESGLTDEMYPGINDSDWLVERRLNQRLGLTQLRSIPWLATPWIHFVERLLGPRSRIELPKTWIVLMSSLTSWNRLWISDSDSLCWNGCLGQGVGLNKPKRDSWMIEFGID